MNRNEIFEAITQVDESLISEARRTAKKHRLAKQTGLCAFFVFLTISAILFIPKHPAAPSGQPHLQAPTTAEPTIPTAGIETIPTAPTTPTAPTAPTTPTVSQRPSIPSNVPGTIVFNHKLTASTPLQGCVGSITETQTPAISADMPPYGVTVSAKAIEILDGIYTYLDDNFQREYLIVRMQTIQCHFGTGMPKEFFLLYPAYDSPDFLTYDSIVINQLTPLGYENQILLNKTTNEFRAFEHILFLSYHLTGIKDGVCAGTLGETESDWNKPEAEIIAEYVSIMSTGRNFEVKSLSSITNSAAVDALQLVKPFENGLFIQQIRYDAIFFDGVYASYRRYLNGYPTNETVYVNNNGANFSVQKFTEEDMKNLPDLPSALQAINAAFDAGEIQPPHLTPDENDTLTAHTIHGWYAKSGDEVFGIIRVGWRYGEIWDIPLLDDKYYLIQQNSDLIIPMETSDLLAILEDGAEDNIFTGEYDESGMIYPLMPNC